MIISKMKQLDHKSYVFGVFFMLLSMFFVSTIKAQISHGGVPSSFQDSSISNNIPAVLSLQLQTLNGSKKSVTSWYLIFS